MKAWLSKYWEDLRASYWFIPTLMAAGAVALSYATTTVDEVFGSSWIDALGWLYFNEAAGARAFLSTVAGSMITVAGVSFSITVAAVVHASSQIGPRLLTNFMRDTGNQITLGTMIATFLYCILVLRAVRAGPGSGGSGTDFVPHFAVLTGLGLAVASVTVFIYFIHHVPASIRVSNVVAEIGTTLNAKLDTLFPDRLGEGGEPATAEGIAAPDDTTVVRAQVTGYLQYVDLIGLLGLAVEHDLTLRLESRPGDFVTVGRPLVTAWPVHRVDNDLQQALRGVFAWGRHRTQTQDALFLVDELVEIAIRALSPGVNDPFTAMICVDWLGASLARLASRRLPDPLRRDDDGTVRVVAYPVSYEEFVDAVFDRLRSYASRDRNAAVHLMQTLATVADGIDNEALREPLAAHAAAFRESCHTHLVDARDLAEIDQAWRRALSRLGGPPNGDGTTAPPAHDAS